MGKRTVRAAIVGASSLLGKEISNELNQSEIFTWDLTLLDPEVMESAQIGGRIASSGDEATLIQAIAPDSFDGLDLVLFAGSAAVTKKHWKQAQSAGAKIVDASGGLYDVSPEAVRSPWMEPKGKAGNTREDLVISAHPAAVMLGLVMNRVCKTWPEARCNATVMEPASQQGDAGMDEMQHQTVALLSFQPLPTLVYGGQVAFNLTACSSPEAMTRLSDVLARVERDLVLIAGLKVADSLALQFVQAPVFTGYTASIYLLLNVTAEAVTSALDGEFLSVISGEDDGPGNLSAAGQGKVLISVREDLHEGVIRGIWLWAAADNLSLAASNAAVCATAIA